MSLTPKGPELASTSSTASKSEAGILLQLQQQLQTLQQAVASPQTANILASDTAARTTPSAGGVQVSAGQPQQVSPEARGATPQRQLHEQQQLHDQQQLHHMQLMQQQQAHYMQQMNHLQQMLQLQQSSQAHQFNQPTTSGAPMSLPPEVMALYQAQQQQQQQQAQQQQAQQQQAQQQAQQQTSQVRELLLSPEEK
jgi:hypothetical protein